MNLSQLYYFKKVAELQHYTNAAKELYITQPSLSESISSLETELGIPLFKKEGRNVKLTKPGVEFYHYVQTALSILEKGIDNAKEKSGTLTGSLDIGCIPTLAGNYLPQVIKGYLKDNNSKAKFNIFSIASKDVIEKIKSCECDIGFCSKPLNEPDIKFIPVLYQEIVAIVNFEHPLAGKDSISHKDLAPYNLVTYREELPVGHNIKSLLTDWNMHADYSFDDEITLCGHVLFFNDVGIAAKTSYLKQFDNLSIIELDAPKDTRIIYMAYSKKNYLSKLGETFIDYVRNNATNLPMY